MSTYTYTYAYTRAEALVDQVDVLFREAGIAETWRSKVVHGVRERYLEAVGLYLARDGKRVYEVEAKINWSAHGDSAELEFSSDLPGWDGTASPEAVILGSRVAARAKTHSLEVQYWGRFTAAIRANPTVHARLCPEVGLLYGGKVPDWSGTPTTRSLPLQDLREVGLSERSTL